MANRIKDTKDVLQLVIIIAVAGIVIWLGFKLYNFIAGTGKSVVTLVKDAYNAVAQPVSTAAAQLNPLSSDAEKSAALETALGGPLPQSEIDKASRMVYHPELDTRSWLEKLFTEPPTSAFVSEVGQ